VTRPLRIHRSPDAAAARWDKACDAVADLSDEKRAVLALEFLESDPIREGVFLDWARNREYDRLTNGAEERHGELA
jgi:hypothetical protein